MDSKNNKHTLSDNTLNESTSNNSFSFKRFLLNKEGTALERWTPIEVLCTNKELIQEAEDIQNLFFVQEQKKSS